MLELPQVTLLCVDCINPAAAVIALQRSAEVCRFGRVVLVTHEMPATLPVGIEVDVIPQLNSREAYSRYLLNELGRHFSTRHVLIAQWDGYVTNAQGWKEHFLEYDYIGAKWWHNDGLNVGNGGFSLRSRKLVDAVRALGLVDCTRNEDDVICREQRGVLEAKHGIRFASEAVADEFAFERGAVLDGTVPFGFHGLFNMWRFLSPAELEELFQLLHPRTIGYVETLELIQQYMKVGRYTQAITVALRVLDHFPNNIQALRMLIASANASGRRWLTLQAIKELHRCEPSNPEHAATLGDIAVLAGNVSEAGQYYRRVLQLRPGDPAVTRKLQTLTRKAMAAASA